jgi:hypothetical protein
LTQPGPQVAAAGGNGRTFKRRIWMGLGAGTSTAPQPEPTHWALAVICRQDAKADDKRERCYDAKADHKRESCQETEHGGGPGVGQDPAI